MLIALLVLGVEALRVHDQFAGGAGSGDVQRPSNRSNVPLTSIRPHRVLTANPMRPSLGSTSVTGPEVRRSSSDRSHRRSFTGYAGNGGGDTRALETAALALLRGAATGRA